MSDSLRPHELQHARPPCPSPTPGVHSDSRPLSQWCHPAISSSVIPFSSCPQSLPASESFPMSQLFPSGCPSTGVSIYIYIHTYIYILNSWHFIWEVKSIKGVGSGYGNPGGNMERVKWMVAQFQNILTVNTESNMNDYKNKLVKTLEHAERWL